MSVASDYQDKAAEHRMARPAGICVWMSVAVLALALNVYLLSETFTVSMSPGAKYATISINVHMSQVSSLESEFQTSNDLLQIWHALYYFTIPALITMFQLCLLRAVLRRYLVPSSIGGSHSCGHASAASLQRAYGWIVRRRMVRVRG